MELHYDLGRDALKAGEYDKAISYLLQSLLISPHFKTYELIGECFLNKEQYDSAILYLSAAAGIGRNQCRARYLLARALNAKGRPDKAAIQLQMIIQQNPDYKRARLLLREMELQGIIPTISDSIEEEC